MAFTFRPGKRGPNEGVPLLIGLVGPSSSGKTKSGLRLATGIQSVAGGSIAVIDTEARRALHYEDEFNFDYSEFEAPFSSLRYIEALESAAKFGAKTIMVDSMSHEHEGPGGYLETHEAEMQRMAGNDWGKRERVKFAAWIKPSGDRRRLINTLLQINANFIFCFRAKEKLQLVRSKEGKMEPVPIGWQAICGDDFSYEMTVRCLLTPGCNGVPDWSNDARKHGVPKLIDVHKPILPEGQQLTEEVGAALARWAAKKPVQIEPTQADSAPGNADDAEKARGVARDIASFGVERFRKYWAELSREQRALINDVRDECQRIAEESDAEGADA